MSAATLVLGCVAYAGAADGADATCEGQPATIVGTAEADRLYGTPGPDVVWLGGTPRAGTDVFVDPGGDDLICQGGQGGAVIQAGPGDDEIHLDSNWNRFEDEVQVYGEDGNDVVDPGAANARQFGGQGDDVLTGVETVDDRLLGGPGDDRLAGLGGDDWLDGGAGDDHVDAGAGADRVIGTAGSDEVDAGAGKDELAYSFWNIYTVTQMDDGITMDLAAGAVTSTSGTTHAVGVECWTGTPYDDVIEGTPAADCVDGGDGPGADTISAGGGDDAVRIFSGVVEGDDGDDELVAAQSRETPGPDPSFAVEAHGGAGADRIDLVHQTASGFGDDGDDVIAFSFSFEATADGGAGADTLELDGGHGSDLDARAGTATFRWSGITHRLSFTRLETYVGSADDDRLRGSWRDERFLGGDGDDTVLGRGGADVILGGAGRDVADGGPGRDRCVAEKKRSC